MLEPWPTSPYLASSSSVPATSRAVSRRAPVTAYAPGSRGWRPRAPGGRHLPDCPFASLSSSPLALVLPTRVLPGLVAVCTRTGRLSCPPSATGLVLAGASASRGAARCSAVRRSTSTGSTPRVATPRAGVVPRPTWSVGHLLPVAASSRHAQRVTAALRSLRCFSPALGHVGGRRRPGDTLSAAGVRRALWTLAGRSTVADASRPGSVTVCRGPRSPCTWTCRRRPVELVAVRSTTGRRCRHAGPGVAHRLRLPGLGMRT